MRLHHVQVSIPGDGLDAARAFYGDALGLVELPRPDGLPTSGCWFSIQDADGRETAQLHASVEEPFRPALRAHPALMLDDVAQLEALGAKVEASGAELSWAERHTAPGLERFHCRDPFGNRVEVLAPAS